MNAQTKKNHLFQKHYKVFFRVNFSKSIGMGHLQRCVTLCRKLKERGFEPIIWVDKRKCCFAGFPRPYFKSLLARKVLSENNDAFLMKKKLHGKNLFLIIVDDYRLANLGKTRKGRLNRLVALMKTPALTSVIF